MNESQRQAWRWLGLGPEWAPLDAPRGKRAGAGAEAVAEAESTAVAGAAAVAEAGPAAVGDPAGGPTSLDWEPLREMVSGCRACALCESRTQTVFGVGPRDARWMLIGEAPGAEEDARGEPFVGQAGRLLDNMLAAMGLSRERDVYIANVLKCRPPRNRDPQPEEVARCSPYLARQVELLSPALIVVMGRFAAQSLLATDASIASLRGRIHGYRCAGRDVPVVVTYHPAYLLRNLADKAKAWQDLCFAQRAMRERGEEPAGAA